MKNPIVQKFIGVYDTILLQQLAKAEEKEIVVV